MRSEINCGDKNGREGHLHHSSRYIRSDSLVQRLIHQRDENPIIVDYDADTDDEEMLDSINRQARAMSNGDLGQEALSVDEFERALHALEVESFELMLQHVEVTHYVACLVSDMCCLLLCRLICRHSRLLRVQIVLDSSTRQRGLDARPLRG